MRREKKKGRRRNEEAVSKNDSWDTSSLRYLCGLDKGSLGLVLPDAVIQLQLR
jgi:hypothetical protein